MAFYVPQPVIETIKMRKLSGILKLELPMLFQLGGLTLLLLTTRKGLHGLLIDVSVPA